MTNHPLQAQSKQVNQEEMISLLHQELQSYLSGSSSLPIEEAESLLQSLLFVLSFSTAPENTPLTKQLIIGKQRINQQLEETKRLYQQVYASMMPLNVTAYWQTVNSIGASLTHYDIDYQAHLVPASIDYLLAQSIDDKQIQGISFLTTYLDHLYWENYFCSFFSRQLDELFQHYEQQLHMNYQHDINNLFRVVFQQALAKQLVNSQTDSLILSSLELTELEKLLKNTQTLTPLLNSALKHLMTRIDCQVSQYYEGILTDTRVELRHSLKHHSLNRYFLTESVSASVTHFTANSSLTDSQFTNLIGELPHVSLKRLPDFLAEKVHSIYDYLDLFNLECFSDDETQSIIENFEAESLVILLRFAGRDNDETFSSYEITLQALTTSTLLWHRLLAHYLLEQPASLSAQLKNLFQTVELTIDDFD